MFRRPGVRGRQPARQCQRFVKINFASAPRARRRHPAPARRLLSTRSKSRTRQNLSRSGTAGRPRRQGRSGRHETRSEPGALRLLGRTARPAPGAGACRHRAGRHSPSPERYLHFELDAANSHSFRLAGTRVCALFGRELKGEAFVDLWALGSRGPITDLLAISTEESVGTVAGVTAHSATGETVDLELLLLPLGMRRPRLARTIGILAPLKAPAWLGASPIGALTLGSRRHVGAVGENRIPPRFMAPRRGLVVHPGGRS